MICSIETTVLRSNLMREYVSRPFAEGDRAIEEALPRKLIQKYKMNIPLVSPKSCVRPYMYISCEPLPHVETRGEYPAHWIVMIAVYGSDRPSFLVGDLFPGSSDTRHRIDKPACGRFCVPRPGHVCIDSQLAQPSHTSMIHVPAAHVFPST